ncbi:MAG: selenocysteine-specific translation elongation factor [Candidatus Omnitrophota bacterium]
MKHLIMGTAGHVDHGKTALIKMLTGIDCDTHPEEKRRGITMNLGFAYYDLPDSSRLGIVDVPGHRNFVHTMAAGASGIDFFLLVIAADSGIMPQTREHVKIIEMFGIKKGIIVLNKIDLIDDELRELNQEEIRDYFKDTLFAGLPVTGVSAKTGAGKEDLQQAIFNLAQSVDEKVIEKIFRMYIDRIFIVEGFGTVVTGTVLGGRLSPGDRVYLLPSEKELRIRRIEHHGREVQEIRAGDRAAINLVGLDRSDFSRGMLISDRILEPSTMIDVYCSVFDQVTGLNVWTSALFHCGTNEIQCRVHLLDCDRLMPKEQAVAQIVLSKPAVILNNDRFILRNTSSDATIGGGTVIDAHPLHHRRRTQRMVEEVKKRIDSNLPELIFSEVRKRYRVVSDKEIADVLNLPADQVLEVVQKETADDIVVCIDNNEAVLLLRNEYKRMKGRVLKRLEVFHNNNPYDERGMTFEAFISVFGFQAEAAGEMFMKCLLASLEKNNSIKKAGNTWALNSHTVTIEAGMEQDIACIENYLKNSGLRTPLISEIIPYAKAKRAIHEKKLRQILHYLASRAKIYEIEGNFIHASVVDACRAKLLNSLKDKSGGITVAQFRDIIKGNRKMCLLLLGQYDAEEIIVRQGDVRVLTEKGAGYV